jgi:hypothetical protein
VTTVHAEYRYYLDVPPEAAFDFLADPGRDAEWQGNCLEAALLDAAQPAVGGRYRIVFMFMGRRVEFVARITRRDKPTACAFETVEGPFRYEGLYGLEAAAGGGVNVHWQFWSRPGGFFGILPLTLLRKVLISQVEKDVASLRKCLALRGAPASPPSA